MRDPARLYIEMVSAADRAPQPGKTPGEAHAVPHAIEQAELTDNVAVIGGPVDRYEMPLGLP